MRKLMLLAAMLAMVLIAAAPAFAQDAIAGDVDNSTTDNSIIQVSQQFQEAAATQVNIGNANATASGDASAASASISQDLSIDQSAVQNTVAGDEANVFGNTGTFSLWFPF